ncbi:ACP phosphodiesterase [Vibrio sp. S4M6]|uniref:acyl carrier protein phosphodiesterase n=1 Tax=Vibrio sinus TaxID=2946865 RepID=UPI002029D52B|nr:ACP phosphodiesterase [Vibrio sinus]MCL9783177.1 ACP phosphodiesterase [Vibrio sinus]
MNYLAHLHIAEHCNASLLGNLLGDFVKGNPNKHFDDNSLIRGVRLHRFVDSHVDSHHLVRQAKSLFPKQLQRFAPIALDVYWDYCLASNWRHYHSDTLPEFCAMAEQKCHAIQLPKMPERFAQVMQYMWKNHWLESYQYLENIEYVLERISQRNPRLAPLAGCFPTLVDNPKSLQELFEDFYPQLLEAADGFYKRYHE